MEILWHAGERIPVWSFEDSHVSAISVLDLVSSLIFRGAEVPSGSLIAARAALGCGSAWSLRVSLLGGAHLNNNENVRGDEDAEDESKCSVGDGILPPQRFKIFHIYVRRGTGLLLWESPLVAAQRVEAFVVATTTDDGEQRAFRVDPVDAQMLIARTVSAAAAGGVACGAAATAFAPDDFQLHKYSRAAEALAVQRTRCAAGGEPWTRMEQLAKLAALRSAAQVAYRCVAEGETLTAENRAALEAVFAGDAAMSAGGESGCEGEGEDESSDSQNR